MRVRFRAVLPPVLLIILAFVLAAAAYRLDWIFLAALFLFGAVILIFDLRGRLFDFANARKYFSDGHKPRDVAKTYQYSWCSRAACRAAASLAGEVHEKAVHAYYRDNGYRWFHIFPDNTFSLNSPFLKLRFWQITLFGNKKARSVLEGRSTTFPDKEEPEAQRTRFESA